MERFIYWFLVVSALSAGALAVATWRQRPTRGARYFTVAILGVALWLGCLAVAYTVWLRGGTVYQVDVIKRLKWIGTFLIAGGIYAFGIAYTNRDRYVQPPILASLAVVPTVTVLGFLVANGIGTSAFPWLETLPLVTEISFWNVVGSGYAYLLLFIGTVALFATMVTHRLTEPTQVGLWALAIGVPWTVNIGHVIGVIPPASEAGFVFNPTPIGYLVTIVAGFVAIVRYDAFQVAPIARAYVVDQIEEAVVVYDDQYRMLDYNESAASRLGLTRETLRADVRTVLSDSDLPVAPPEGDTETDEFDEWIDGREFTVDVEGESVVLVAAAEPLVRDRETDVSPDYALVLQDVSERARRESRLRTQNEQLQLLNRIVHHDIRNEMNLILELLKDEHRTQTQSGDGRVEAVPAEHNHLETVIESGEHVVELTETAHTLTNAVSEATEERKPIPLGPVLRREVANASALSRDVTVEFDGDIPEVDVLANEMLASVFRNLLTNAIQHNDADDPRVTLRASLHDDRVQITVSDNGPGLSEHARQRLVSGDSSPGQDGGIGLLLIRTLVDQYDGRISTDSNDPRGTVVTVELDVPG